MELDMTWEEAAQAAGGALVRGDARARFSRVVIDNRKALAGDVFIALKGARHDAHAFLDAGLAKTCAGWVVARGCALPPARPPAVLEVADTRDALGALARARRRRFDIPVVGVTGTNGKTTVKEMLRAVFARRGPVCANAGNFNNEVGLPLSVMELEQRHWAAVFEMGASRPGDIRTLARIALPTIGVLTNIGPAHLEFFGDVETVFKTKTELLAELPDGAPVVLNADDERLRGLLPSLGSRALTFGAAPDAKVRILPRSPDETGGIRLETPDGLIQVPGERFGSIHRVNAAAAAAAALAAGLTASEIASGLRGFQPGDLRFILRRHSTGAALVVDTYNANPASMRAGVGTFLETCMGDTPFAVLGDMAELGTGSKTMHRELGQWLGTQPLAGLFLAGREMGEAASALRRAGAPFPVVHAEELDDLAAPLLGVLQAGTAVYLKASRSMRLEKLIERL